MSMVLNDADGAIPDVVTPTQYIGTLHQGVIERAPCSYWQRSGL